MLPQRTTWSPQERERARRRLLPNVRRAFHRDPRFRRYYYIQPQSNRRVNMRTSHTNILAARRGQTNRQFESSLRGFYNHLDTDGLQHIQHHVNRYLGYGPTS